MRSDAPSAEYFVETGARIAIPWVVDPEVPMLKKRLGDRFSDEKVFLKRVDVGDEVANRIVRQ